MVQFIQGLFRRRYFLLQATALLLWLVLEFADYGTGALYALMHRPLTNAAGSRLNDLIAGAPPPGPMRLSRGERERQAQRIAAAFGGNPPKHDTLGDLRYLYQTKKGSLCDWRPSNVAADPKECNDLADASPLFLKLLARVHPKFETLYLREVTGNKGERVVFAFFVGTNDKPQILVDLSRASSLNWNTGKGFVLKAYSGDGLGEIALGKPIDGNAMFVVDDPGALPRRDRSCAVPACLARLLVYGYKLGTVDSLGRPVTDNLAEISLDEPLEQRFKLFAAIRGEVYAAAPVANLDMAFKPDKFSVTVFEMARLKRKLDAAMGAGTTDRARFSPYGYHVAFGTVFGFALDGKLYTIWDGGTPYKSLGTDAMVFHIGQGSSSRAIDGVRSADGVHVLAYPGNTTPDKRTSLVVRKAIEPTGKPWSEFADFPVLFTLRARRN